MNTKGVVYTDEEVLEIRDWLYRMIEIILDAEEREKQKKEQYEQNNKQAA